MEWNLVSWKSKKKTKVAGSSAQAEYQALLDLMKEIMCIKIVLKQAFHLSFNNPTTIYKDNQSAIKLAHNAANHSNFRTKHMFIKYHFIRQEVKLETIK